MTKEVPALLIFFFVWGQVCQDSFDVL